MARILVAEDEPDIRNLIAITLQFNGYDVVTVQDGSQAIEAAEKGGFDLILLDVRMPRKTGYEACRYLRTLEITKTIPILFLSAKGQESEIETGIAAGADEYILKPFAPNALVERIATYLEKP